MNKRSVEQSVFDEYIRCNLSNQFSQNKNCSANDNEAVRNNVYEDCVCVPHSIYVFAMKFFFPKKEPIKCCCPRFGMESDNPQAGYTVYDTLSLDGKSNHIRDLFFAMGETPAYSNTGEVFAILLCTYLDEIINQLGVGLEYPDYSYFSTMIDEIDRAYRGMDQNTDVLLCEIYFYICVCIRGCDTFSPYRLHSIFCGISKYSKGTAKNICDNLDVVITEVKQKKKYMPSLQNLKSFLQKNWHQWA